MQSEKVNYLNKKIDKLVNSYPLVVKKNKIKASIITALFVCAGVATIFYLEQSFALSETSMLIPVVVGTSLVSLGAGSKLGNYWFEKKEANFYDKIKELKNECEVSKSYAKENTNEQPKEEKTEVYNINDGHKLSNEDIKDIENDASIADINYAHQLSDPKISHEFYEIAPETYEEVLGLEEKGPVKTLRRPYRRR